MRTPYRVIAPVAPLLLLLGCGPDAEHPLEPGVQAFAFVGSEWSEPVNLGPPINTEHTEIQPALSTDGLSLYFASNRPGGAGGNDIWVSQRACEDCPWATPVNVAMLNTAVLDGGPSLSRDGHLLFFHSNRPGGHGDNDIYMTRRDDPKDDFGWGTPVLLGEGVNTEALDNKAFFQKGGDLYFNRGPSAGAANDIFVARIGRDGTVRSPAVLVEELSDPDANDQGAHLRADGREVFFQSTRAGSLGRTDIYVSTRPSAHGSWSTPRNVTVLNSTVRDSHPYLSRDATVLLFISERPGGEGQRDIWMSTRQR